MQYRTGSRLTLRHHILLVKIASKLAINGKETKRKMIPSKRNDGWADSLFLDKTASFWEVDQSRTKVGIIASSQKVMSKVMSMQHGSVFFFFFFLATFRKRKLFSGQVLIVTQVMPLHENTFSLFARTSGLCRLSLREHSEAGWRDKIVRLVY